MITNYMADIENSIILGKRYGAEYVVDNFYVALSITPITSHGEGMIEPSDVNYHRILVPNDMDNFTMSDIGITKNSKEWRFPMSTIAWKPITHWAIMDSETGGKVLYYDALSAPMMVDVHQEVFFNPESVIITRGGV